MSDLLAFNAFARSNVNATTPPRVLTQVLAWYPNSKDGKEGKDTACRWLIGRSLIGALLMIGLDLLGDALHCHFPWPPLTLHAPVIERMITASTLQYSSSTLTVVEPHS